MPDLAVDESLRDQLEDFDLARRRFLLELPEGSGERNHFGVALTELLGSAPNRRFVIEWRNASFFPCTPCGDRLDFEVVLYVAGQDLLALRGVHDNPRIGRRWAPL